MARSLDQDRKDWHKSAGEFKDCRDIPKPVGTFLSLSEPL
ncbi:unnamed protein product [marine sediment metagenome]|uniref:Uncharacterized protein n=1 Tax=marine sediment metagenome TaxID=412755 RepID=X1TH90_9ZZZZ